MKSSEIRKIISKYEPKLEFIVLSDPDWLPCDIEELSSWIKDNISDLHLKHIFECEEHTLRILALRREERARRFLTERLPVEQKFNEALFIVWGSKFEGYENNHFDLVAFSEDKMYIIKAQTGEYWEYNDDKILFLFG